MLIGVPNTHNVDGHTCHGNGVLDEALEQAQEALILVFEHSYDDHRTCGNLDLAHIMRSPSFFI